MSSGLIPNVITSPSFTFSLTKSLMGDISSLIFEKSNTVLFWLYLWEIYLVQSVKNLILFYFGYIL